MQNTIGVFEAKTKFTNVIDKVSEGDEFVITKHNSPVAKLIPISKEGSISARDASIRIRKLAKEINSKNYDWEEWKQYRDLGRA